MAQQVWSSDCLISAPAPIDDGRPAVVHLGGFSWTTGGITHDLTEGDRDELLTPSYAPEDWDEG